jgi:type 1 glutamine amidotransferase
VATRIGGRYAEADGKAGQVTEAVGYQHDVEIPVTLLTPHHPITAGLENFTLHDEIYWGFRMSPDVTPLLGTTQAKSGKVLAWAKQAGHSKLVYLQLGHGPSAWGNENYRKFLAQTIQWVAP